MEPEEKKRKAVDFSIKAAWLAISKMYNTLGADYDITHSTGFVLLNIDKDKGTPATKIAPEIGMEARSLTRMLKAMEEKGLIERVADLDDKRKVIIKLTDDGQVKREMSRQTVKAFHDRIHKLISEDKLESFFYVVEKLHEIMEDDSNNMIETIRERLAEQGITEEGRVVHKS